MLAASFGDLARIVVVGALAYVGLVAMLRVTGKRTLTKFNAFDFVVTVALGSTLATILLDASVSLAEGLVALGLLIGLQWAVTALSVRAPRFQRLVKASPALLVWRGAPIEEALRRERVTREEILAAARASGVSDLASVAAAILETDGSLSILTSVEEDAAASALATVPRLRRTAAAPDGSARSRPDPTR